MKFHLEYDTSVPGGVWFIEVCGVPGLMSQGDTVKEALDMIQDAAELYFEDFEGDLPGDVAAWLTEM